MSAKIYVGNLSYNASEGPLKNLFAQFGEVSSCKLITDRDTGRNKGFAFVEMDSADDASVAINSLDGQEFEGRNLRVNEAKPQERRERSSRDNRW